MSTVATLFRTPLWRAQLFLATCLILVCLFSASSASRAQQAAEPAYSLEQRMFILAKIHSAIDKYFAHWYRVEDLDPDALYKEYLPKAISIEDRYHFDLLMMEMVNRLENGHSWFRDAWLVRVYGQSLGFDFRFLNDRWVVTESSVPQLQGGDILDVIDGKSFESFYQDNKRYLDLASDRTARASFPTYQFLFPRRFSLRLANGKTVQINRTEPPPQHATVSGRWIAESTIAYIRMPHFGDDATESDAISFVRQFQHATALIIDVRGYAGGNTPGRLVEALMDRPYRYFAEASSISVGLFQYFAEKDRKDLGTFSEYFRHPMLSWPALYHQPKNTVFTGKLLLLVDGGCVSAKEGFIVPFKDNKRAILVGETTGGTSGQPYFYSFDKDASLGIGAKLEYLPDGSKFEGIGIEPDITVVPTLEDFQHRRDPVLARATAIARGER